MQYIVIFKTIRVIGLIKNSYILNNAWAKTLVNLLKTFNKTIILFDGLFKSFYFYFQVNLI